MTLERKLMGGGVGAPLTATGQQPGFSPVTSTFYPTTSPLPSPSPTLSPPLSPALTLSVPIPFPVPFQIPSPYPDITTTPTWFPKRSEICDESLRAAAAPKSCGTLKV